MPDMLELLADSFREDYANDTNYVQETLDSMIQGYVDGIKER